MFILISLGLTIILFGPENFKFTNINWITYKDTLIDQLAWKFFYNDNWHFPLGKIQIMELKLVIQLFLQVRFLFFQLY